MENVFYKATRPDAKSFHSHNRRHVTYAVGETIAIPKARIVAEPHLCSSDVLHASDAPGETLIGGSWPCRLFEVTGTPVAGPDHHKFGFIELHVEREIEAWRALGPNGQEIAAFIDALKGLDAAAWDAARAAAWDAARAAAWAAAWAAARAAAWAAAWAAALALCARDLISDEQFSVLYAPWEPHIPAATLGSWTSLK